MSSLEEHAYNGEYRENTLDLVKRAIFRIVYECQTELHELIRQSDSSRNPEQRVKLTMSMQHTMDLQLRIEIEIDRSKDITPRPYGSLNCMQVTFAKLGAMEVARVVKNLDQEERETIIEDWLPGVRTHFEDEISSQNAYSQLDTLDKNINALEDQIRRGALIVRAVQPRRRQ